MKKKIGKSIDIKQLKKVRRKATGHSQTQLISTSFLDSQSIIPLVITPAVENVDIVDWAELNRDLIEKEILCHGGILFRGFNINSVEIFESFALRLCPSLYGDYGDLPPEGSGEKIYHSTPYPSDKAILFHNESSHMASWPTRQFFSCLKVAETGGETPIVDCRKIYDLLDKKVRDRFEEKGLGYIRNFVKGLDVSWQDFFKTRDRAKVEEICRDSGIECEWIRGDNLRTLKRCMAVATHPKTREKVFFNQIQLHHTSCLDAEVRSSLKEFYTEDFFPRNVVYGDGAKIEDSIVQEIIDLYYGLSVDLAWKKGDAVALDNMLVAHARNPFSGARKVIVALGEMLNERQYAEMVFEDSVS